MREFFTISGYWKDNGDLFEELIVTNYDDAPDETYPYTEEDIFYFGLEETDLEQLVLEGENTIEDFVVTEYTRIIL